MSSTMEMNDGTQLFFKPNVTSTEEDIYDVETQAFEVANNSSRNNGVRDESDVVPRSKRAAVTEKSNEKYEKKKDAAADHEARKQQSPRRKRISELKDGDWEQLCKSANNNQGDVVFKGVFDRCKDLRKVLASNVSVASAATNQAVVAEVPIRQSVKRRAKIKNGESNDADPISSKRQKLITEPIMFKVLIDSVPTAPRKPSDVPRTVVKPEKNSTIDAVDLTQSDNAHELKFEAPKDSSKSQPVVKASKVSSKAAAASTKSNSVAPPEAKASEESLKVLLASSKQDADENIDLEMQHTQVFVKASSTPKEPTKPDRPRRQARSAMMGQERPKVTAVLASANLNGNVFEYAKSGDSVEQSTADVSRQTRKRKASDSSDSGNQKYTVVFTMVDPTPHITTLRKLNIIITTESSNYNCLITDKVYLTPKFMCALAAGKPIVSLDWLEALKTKNAMVDPFEYLLKDADGEKRFQFNLQNTLQKVQQNGKLCRNHSILVTPNTSPSPDILKDIIVSSGGKYLETSLSARNNDTVLCISNMRDEQLCNQFKMKYPNLKVVNSKYFIHSIIQYKI